MGGGGQLLVPDLRKTVTCVPVSRRLCRLIGPAGAAPELRCCLLRHRLLLQASCTGGAVKTTWDNACLPFSQTCLRPSPKTVNSWSMTLVVSAILPFMIAGQVRAWGLRGLAVWATLRPASVCLLPLSCFALTPPPPVPRPSSQAVQISVASRAGKASSGALEAANSLAAEATVSHRVVAAYNLQDQAREA